MEKKSIARAIASRLRARRRARWLCALFAALSLGLLCLFWGTDVFERAVLSNLVLRDGSPSFLHWQRPPVDLTVKVYVFSYTNLHEFEDGSASKLRVREVGPFVYRERLTRVNAVVHANQTVTYQEKRTYRWVSGLPETERVTVPNVLLMSALAYARNLPYVTQIAFTVFLSGLRTKPFLDLAAGEYLWGYEDRLFRVAKPFAPLGEPLPHDKFGILAFKAGLNSDRITMHTGVDDLRNLGMIERINGRASRGVWADESCDRVYGTDGSMFPPHWMRQPNSTLYVYAKDACRRLPFRYDGRATSHGIPTLRYKLPSNVFTSTRDKDSCFCPRESRDPSSERCPPAGTIDLSACKFGTPLLVSFPHFYSGDESLFRDIEGLEPRRDRHESYIDLHPRLGVTVGTRLRLQLNVEVRKAPGVPFSGNLRDGAILPLIWLDSSIEDLPDATRDVLSRSHYAVNAIEAGLRWGSLIGALLSFTALLAAFKRNLDRDEDEDEEEEEDGNEAGAGGDRKGEQESWKTSSRCLELEDR